MEITCLKLIETRMVVVDTRGRGQNNSSLTQLSVRTKQTLWIAEIILSETKLKGNHTINKLIILYEFSIRFKAHTNLYHALN